MTAWRVIITDTESLTGVAPVCENSVHERWAALNEVEGEAAKGTGCLVYDCCPHPHIETWDEVRARQVALALTETEAEICS